MTTKLKLDPNWLMLSSSIEISNKDLETYLGTKRNRSKTGNALQKEVFEVQCKKL